MKDKMTELDAKIVETIKQAQKEKGYSVDIDDVNKILAELDKTLRNSKSNISRRWLGKLTSIEGRCSILWDPSNIFYIYKDIGEKPPEWIKSKYSEHS